MLYLDIYKIITICLILILLGHTFYHQYYAMTEHFMGGGNSSNSGDKAVNNMLKNNKFNEQYTALATASGKRRYQMIPLETTVYASNNIILGDCHLLSSYNSTILPNDSPKYSNTQVVRSIIQAGVRCIHLDILGQEYDVDNTPPVCTIGNEITNTQDVNYISFRDVVDTIEKYAFNDATLDNRTDPFFIILNLKVDSNWLLADTVGKILQEILGNRIYEPNPNVSLFDTPLNKLIGRAGDTNTTSKQAKCVIISGIEINPTAKLRVGTPPTEGWSTNAMSQIPTLQSISHIWEHVTTLNTKPTTDTSGGYTPSEIILYRAQYLKDISNYLGFIEDTSKNNFVISTPDIVGNNAPTNQNYASALILGCNVVFMNWMSTDKTELNNYIDMFAYQKAQSNTICDSKTQDCPEVAELNITSIIPKPKNLQKPSKTA